MKQKALTTKMTTEHDDATTTSSFHQAAKAKWRLGKQVDSSTACRVYDGVLQLKQSFLQLFAVRLVHQNDNPTKTSAN